MFIFDATRMKLENLFQAHLLELFLSDRAGGEGASSFNDLQGVVSFCFFSIRVYFHIDQGCMRERERERDANFWILSIFISIVA